MVNGLYILILKNKVLILLILSTIITGCNSTIKQNNKLILSQDKLVSGDLVCRFGDGFFSKYFKDYASSEKKYSHIGLISREGDKLFVYHSEASEFTGIGFVKKEPLDVFLEGIEIYDFFKLKFHDSINLKITKHVEYFYNAKTPFDMDFDSFDEKKLYCSELIAVSINKALDSSFIKPTLTLNNKKIYGLDDIYLNENVIKTILKDTITQ